MHSEMAFWPMQSASFTFHMDCLPAYNQSQSHMMSKYKPEHIVSCIQILH